MVPDVSVGGKDDVLASEPSELISVGDHPKGADVSVIKYIIRAFNKADRISESTRKAAARVSQAPRTDKLPIAWGGNAEADNSLMWVSSMESVRMSHSGKVSNVESGKCRIAMRASSGSESGEPGLKVIGVFLFFWDLGCWDVHEAMGERHELLGREHAAGTASLTVVATIELDRHMGSARIIRVTTERTSDPDLATLELTRESDH
jgi:hypothetical protein